MNDIKTLNIDEILKNMMKCSETIEASDKNNILKRDEEEYERLLQGSKIIPDYVDMDGLNDALSGMRENVKEANDGTTLSYEYLDAYNKLVDCINDIAKINEKYITIGNDVTLDEIVENKEAVDNFYKDNDNPINFSAYNDDDVELIKEEPLDNEIIDESKTNHDFSSIHNFKTNLDGLDELKDIDIKPATPPYEKIAEDNLISSLDGSDDELQVNPTELVDSSDNSNTLDGMTDNYDVKLTPKASTVVDYIKNPERANRYSNFLEKESDNDLVYLEGLIKSGKGKDYNLTEKVLNDCSAFEMMAMAEAIRKVEDSSGEKLDNSNTFPGKK